MTFFSVLLALILEQVRALSTQNPVYNLIRSHATHTSQTFDAGQPRHGVLAWLVVVLPFVLVVAVVYYLLMRVNIFLGFAWNVLIVYLTMGFRQFSHYFTDIHVALNNDNVNEAREILRQWIGIDTVDMPVDEIVRHTLLHAVIASHRHVFGVFFWFLMPIGPAGAVLYRLAEYLSRRWTEPAPDRSPAFGAFARRAFYVIDWVPARLTAIGWRGDVWEMPIGKRLARVIAQSMGATLKRTVIVENKPGAGGNIAAQYVAKSAPDGSTLLMSFTSHTINATLFKNLPFNPVADFTPITMVAQVPSVLVARRPPVAHGPYPPSAAALAASHVGSGGCL